MELTIADLSVALGKRMVIDRLSARLAAGRVTVILGPNGAGKSTLLRTIAALLDPRAGSVTIDGRDVARLAPRERARMIGYLPQEARVHWNVSAREVVALGRVPHRSPHTAQSPHDVAAIEAALAATATRDLADRPVNELSGGERARVLLARVLAGEPRWLLADEPLASLDPAHRVDLLDRLREVARRGAGVVLVLHDLAQAARIADDVLLLGDGRLAGFGPTCDTLTPEAIAALFGIEARWIDVDGAPVLVPLGRV